MLSVVLSAINTAAINVTKSTHEHITSMKKAPQSVENKRKLPPDTLINVFTYLQAKDVADVCARVSADWRALIVYNKDANNDDKERCDMLWKTLYSLKFPQMMSFTLANSNWRQEYENRLQETVHPCGLCQGSSTFADRVGQRPKFIKPCECPIGYVHVRCWNHTRRYKNEELLVVKSYRGELPFQFCTHCRMRYKLKEDPQYDGTYFSDKETTARKRMNLSPLVISVFALLIYCFLDRINSSGLLPNEPFYFLLGSLVFVWLLIMLIILEVNTRFYNDEMVKKYYLVDFDLAPDSCDQSVQQKQAKRFNR